jgi:hypothetical protein
MHRADVHGFDISKEGGQTARVIAAANGVTDRCSFTRQSASSLSYHSETFDGPASLRARFTGLVAVDTVLEDIEALDPYCLEVVGRFEK